MTSESPSALPRWLRFGAIGGAATSVHVLVAALMINGGGMSSPRANAIAVVSASAVSYLGHAWWTFGAGTDAASAVRFVVVTACSAAIAASISALSAMTGQHWLVGVAASTIAVPAFSYFAHRNWTFSSGPSTT